MPSETTQGSATTGFKVSGMHCGACVNRVRKVVLKVPGVQSADVNLSSERARITYQPGVATRENIVAAIVAAGYTAEPIA